MKRTLLIVGGITIVIILIAIWAYILFTGTTNDNVSFSDFGFGDTTDSTVILPTDETIPEEIVTPNDQEERLRQLTTVPVAGFMQTRSAGDSDSAVRYVESGTGHIYEINLATQESTRVSATTIPLASRAVITPNGKHVLIQSDAGSRANFVIGTISSSSDRLSNFELNQDVVSFSVTNDNVFLYATRGVGELIAKSYEPERAVTTTLFSIPFVDATVNWGSDVGGPHTVYPKTTRHLEGYAYSYLSGVPTRVNATGFGLAAVGSNAATIYSEIIDDQYQTFTIENGGLDSAQTPLVFMPEKCAFTNSINTTVICGADFAKPSSLMPDSWYRGNDVTDDAIWEYNTVRQSARLLADPETATGRQIDLINPRFSTDDSNLFFQNKTDQTLWVYQYVVTN